VDRSAGVLLIRTGAFFFGVVLLSNFVESACQYFRYLANINHEPSYIILDEIRVSYKLKPE
jgi:hypothetical protein